MLTHKNRYLKRIKFYFIREHSRQSSGSYYSAINKSNYATGIVVGIGSLTYSVILEDKKFGTILTLFPVEVLEEDIIVSFSVPMDELLTHENEKVRIAAKLRLEVHPEAILD